MSHEGNDEGGGMKVEAEGICHPFDRLRAGSERNEGSSESARFFASLRRTSLRAPEEPWTQLSEQLSGDPEGHPGFEIEDSRLAGPRCPLT